MIVPSRDRIIAAAATVLLTVATHGAYADTPLDYLVQEVCDDGQGGHTTADPVTCLTRARKLRIGEALPYHKWDGPTPSTAVQISDSYPIASLNGGVRVVQTYFFDNQSAFLTPTFDASDPKSVNANPALGRTGYDLLGADGTYVAAMGTYDPGAGWQPFWQRNICSLVDTWVDFPKSGPIPLPYGSTVTALINSSPQCPTNGNYGSSYTVWNYYNGVHYESGKHLNTIKVWHFNGSTINAAGIEEFYFSKEYGGTRWEAWSAQVSAPNPSAVTKCPTGTNGGVAVFSSTTYYLIDCQIGAMSLRPRLETGRRTSIGILIHFIIA